MNQKRALALLLAASQFVPLIAFEASHPSSCDCQQDRLAPVPISRPLQPETGWEPPPTLREQVSSAASDGSVMVRPGVGELELKGFAPTISVTT
jgi:hypothetical protein